MFLATIHWACNYRRCLDEYTYGPSGTSDILDAIERDLSLTLLERLALSDGISLAYSANPTRVALGCGTFTISISKA